MTSLPTRAARLALLAALPALVAACNADAVRFPEPNGPMASEPRYHHEQVAVRHMVRFAPGSNSLNQIEQVALHDFLMTAGPRAGEIAVVSASGPGASARGNAVVQTLRRHGVQGSLHMAAGAAGDPVIVSFVRDTYLASACLQADQGADLTRPPLGCANATNLARMVENPDDLVRPGTVGRAESSSAIRAIGNYRAGVTPSLDGTTGAAQ